MVNQNVERGDKSYDQKIKHGTQQAYTRNMCSCERCRAFWAARIRQDALRRIDRCTLIAPYLLGKFDDVDIEVLAEELGIRSQWIRTLNRHGRWNHPQVHLFTLVHWLGIIIPEFDNDLVIMK
jgi:hypothetical protein